MVAHSAWNMAVQRHACRAIGDDLYGELRTALVRLRGDAGADAMARRLVRRDFRQELVALVDGGTRAAYYDPLARRIHVLPFDESGIDDGAGEVPWRSVEDPASWVDARRDDLDWVHGRYRWVLDLPAGRTVR